jgi:hypothetical protein
VKPYVAATFADGNRSNVHIPSSARATAVLEYTRTKMDQKNRTKRLSRKFTLKSPTHYIDGTATLLDF